jgi:AcrR family transcriptional regulator
MPADTLQAARSALVRERVLDGVAELLAAGEELTFARVAKAAGVPERTVYRHFPTREGLLTAVYHWANQRIEFDGDLPVDVEGAVRLVRRVFAGFDEIAPVIRELLVAPEGLAARLSENDRRQQAATAIVRHEAPGLDRATTRRVAATVQLLTAAATWQTLRDYWDMDGTEAAETAALAIELVLGAARARGADPGPPAESHASNQEPR